MSDDNAKKDLWERVASIALIPLAIAVVGNMFAHAIKDREVKAQFVGLAVDILKEEPTDETTNLRIWAIDIIDEYSGVSLPAEARQELEKAPLAINQRILRSGDAGADVYEIQRQLVALGYMDFVDGIYGPAMEEAVRKFQMEIGMGYADGVVGSATRIALQREYQKTLQPGNQPPSPQPSTQPSTQPPSQP